MKRLFTFLFLAFCIAGCDKAENSRDFTIVAHCVDSSGGVLSIENEQYSFSGSTYSKELHVGEFDVYSVNFIPNGNGIAILDLMEGGVLVSNAYGTGRLYMLVEYEGGKYITQQPTSGGGSSSGSNCATVQCSATTQSGSRCKRMTTNCNGRCWQHQ